ncbi:MAG TPA: YdbH domain-containing protein [Alcanivorax sp.]|nr:YdbH domain-containing protein [Alcanivorax sp.]
MAKRFLGKRLIWLLPLLIAAGLLLAVLVALLAVRLAGWHWQGPGWRDGLTLQSVWQEQDGCRPFSARGVRLSALRPLTLRVDTLGIHACPDDGDDFTLTEVPSLPALDVTVWAVQYRDLPPVMVNLTQRDGVWRARAEFRDSRLSAEYRRGSGRWRLSGTVQGGHLDQRLAGVVRVQGDGLWLPGDWTDSEYFAGELVLLGRDLGLETRGPRGNVTVRGQWQGDDWRLRAGLDEPLAVGAGWVVSPGQDLQARGEGAALTRADGRLVASGPQGRAVLSLSSDAARLGQGQGSLSLSEGLSGDIEFRWRDGQVVVSPFEVGGLAEGLTVRLREAVSAPLAMRGQASVPLSLAWQDLSLSTTESALAWRPNDLQWRGAVTLEGRWQGYRVSGGWRGDAGPTGVHGGPARVRLESSDLDVTARLPVDGLRPPRWPFQASVEGRYRSVPFRGVLTGALGDGVWAGRIEASGEHFYSLVPALGQGGPVTAKGRWRWRENLSLLAGSRLSVGGTVSGTRLVKPVTLRVSEPLVIGDGGPTGALAIRAEGLVAERWTLPPVTGTARLDGAAFSADLSVAQWGTRLSMSGRQGSAGLSGTLRGQSPLVPAMSRGLPVTTRAGELVLDGRWHWRDAFEIKGTLHGDGLALNWGSIEARGLDGELALAWRQGQAPRIHSLAPLTLATLDVGVPVTEVRMGVDTDLDQWRFQDISAQVLGGEIRAPRLVWPSPVWQPVVLTGIELSQLAALQGKAVVSLTGEVGGYIPLRLGRDSVAVRNGRLANETPLSLALLPAAGTQAMAESNRAVSIALEALNPLRVEHLSAEVDMAADGWLDAAVHIRGRNPQRNGLPVVFNYTHKENVLELLRSLRIGERITDRVMTETRP